MTVLNRSRRPRHRHFVAMPIVAVLLLSSFSFVSTSPLVGSLTSAVSAQNDADVHTLDDGTVVVLQDDGTYSMVDGWLTVKRGALLLAGRGLVTSAFDDMDVLGWNGGYAVTVNDRTLTVAALTTPVLIRRDAERVIVPVGMQWRSDVTLASTDDGLAKWIASRLPTPLPESYIQEQYAILRDLVLPPTRTATVALPSVPQALLLPAAQERARAADVSRTLQALADSMDTDDVSAVRAQLTSDAVIAALSSPDAAPFLPGLLQAAAQREGLVSYVLPFLTQERDLWLLLAFHPATQDEAWVQPLPATAIADDGLLRDMLLPASDRQPRPVSTFTYERWSMDLRDALLASADPSHVVQTLLPIVSSTLEFAQSHGYERRASDLVTAFSRAVQDKGVSLAPDVQTSVSAVRAIKASAPDADPEVVAVLSADDSVQLEQKAAALLSTVGGREGKTTAYEAVDGHTVNISDMIFGVHAYSFVFDLKADTVRDVSQGEARFPYETDRSAFAAWAGEQK